MLRLIFINIEKSLTPFLLFQNNTQGIRTRTRCDNTRHRIRHASISRGNIVFRKWMVTSWSAAFTVKWLKFELVRDTEWKRRVTVCLVKSHSVLGQPNALNYITNFWNLRWITRTLQDFMVDWFTRICLNFLYISATLMKRRDRYFPKATIKDIVHIGYLYSANFCVGFC